MVLHDQIVHHFCENEISHILLQMIGKPLENLKDELCPYEIQDFLDIC